MSIKLKQVKFGIGIGFITIAAVWLGLSGFQEGKSYYLTVDEMFAMGSDVYGERIRLAGIVKTGSIEYHTSAVNFIVEQDENIVPIKYIGTTPLPDTFTDETQVVAEGSYNQDGTFYAHGIQAKCASKYEAELK